MQNLINKIILDYPMTAAQLIRDLQNKKELFPTIKDDITAAIQILSSDCWLKMKRSQGFWNKVVNDRIEAYKAN